MSRRTKLILLGIFLALLAIPTWHVASNWNPPNPLRFRLVSRTALPDKDGFCYERLDFEMLNTSTAPRRIEDTTLKYSYVAGIDPFAPDVFESGTVIPADGTARGAAILRWPKGKSPDLDSLEIFCFQASTFRHRVLQWYGSLVVSRLPVSQQERFHLAALTQSTPRLEIAPEHSGAGRAASLAPSGVLEYFTPDKAP